MGFLHHRDTEEHRGPQRTTKPKVNDVAPLWPSVLLRASVMKNPVPRPPSPVPRSRRDAYCFTAQRTETVSTTFSSPGFTGVGSSLAASPTDFIMSILMGMGGSDGPPLEISISDPSW